MNPCTLQRVATLFLLMAGATICASPTEETFSVPGFSDSTRAELAGVTEPFTALGRLKALASRNPRDPAVWYGLAKTYEHIGELAVRQLERLARESAEWNAAMGSTALKDGNLVDALRYYRTALQKNPQIRGVHQALAEVYQMLGEEQQAASELAAEKALGQPDCSREPLACQFAQGKLDQLLESTMREPGPTSCYWRVQAAFRRAREMFSKLDELGPSVERYAWHAERAEAQGDFITAIVEWQNARKLAPGNSRVTKELVEALLANSDLEEAGKVIEELLKQEPQWLETHRLAGELYYGTGRYEQALPHLEKVVAAEPENLGFRAALGRTYMLLGRYQEAIPHLEKALPGDKDGSLHLDLSSAYRRLGNDQRANELLRESWRLAEPGEAATHQVTP